MHSSYKIIKAYANPEKKVECVIPVNDIEGDTNISVLDHEERAKIEAEQILQQAKYEAQQIKEEALKKAEKEAQVMIEELKNNTYNNAYKAGFEEGKTEGANQGLLEGQEQGEVIRKQAKFVLENAHQMAQNTIDKNESEIIALSVHIAKKILLKAISENHEHLIDIAKDAFIELKNKAQIIIRVYPTRSSLFLNHIESFKEICPNTVFTVLEDEAVDETGCIIETDTQNIDIQITSQLEAVKEALLEMRTNNE